MKSEYEIVETIIDTARDLQHLIEMRCTNNLTGADNSDINRQIDDKIKQLDFLKWLFC